MHLKKTGKIVSIFGVRIYRNGRPPLLSRPPRPATSANAWMQQIDEGSEFKKALGDGGVATKISMMSALLRQSGCRRPGRRVQRTGMLRRQFSSHLQVAVVAERDQIHPLLHEVPAIFDIAIAKRVLSNFAILVELIHGVIKASLKQSLHKLCS